jgi:hypothetical protein
LYTRFYFIIIWNICQNNAHQAFLLTARGGTQSVYIGTHVAAKPPTVTTPPPVTATTPTETKTPTATTAAHPGLQPDGSLVVPGLARPIPPELVDRALNDYISIKAEPGDPLPAELLIQAEKRNITYISDETLVHTLVSKGYVNSWAVTYTDDNGKIISTTTIFNTEWPGYGTPGPLA